MLVIEDMTLTGAVTIGGCVDAQVIEQVITGVTPFARSNSGRRSSTTALTPFENKPFIEIPISVHSRAGDSKKAARGKTSTTNRLQHIGEFLRDLLAQLR